MISQKSHSPKAPLINGNENDALLAFAQFNENHQREIALALRQSLRSHPKFSEIIESQTDDELDAQDEIANAIQRKAIIDGEWDQYYKHLVSQGEVYAKAGLEYSDWFVVIKIYRDEFSKVLQKQYSKDFKRAFQIIEGANKLIDFAMSVISDAYFNENNRIITAEKNKLKIALNELTESESRLNAIIENSKDNIFVIDKTGKIVSINHVDEGFKKEDVLGQNIFDFQFINNTGRNATIVIKETLRVGTSDIYDVEMMVNGHVKVYANSIAPLRDKENKIKGAILISRDITSRKINQDKLQKLNAELIASQERFDLAVSGSSSGIWDWDIITDEVFYSARYKALLGYSEDEFPNEFTSFTDVLHPDDKPDTFKHISDAISDDIPYDVTYRLKTKSGEYKWFMARGKVLRDEHGVANRMAGSIADITQRIEAENVIKQLNATLDEQVKAKTKSLKESEQKLQNIIKHAGVGIALLDENGVFIEVNPAFTRLLGYNQNEIIGKQHTYFTDPSDIDKDIKFYNRLKQGNTEIFSLEKRYITKNGDKVWAQVTNTVLSRGLRPNSKEKSNAKAIKIVNDISKERELNSKISGLKDQLEEQIEQIKAVNQELESFSHTVSHDLRAPLRAINGFTKVLNTKLDGKLDDSTTHYLDVIVENVSKMGRLIDDLLSFSRMGRLSKQSTTFSLGLLYNEVYGELMQSETKKVDFRLNDLPQVTADRNMLKQVVSNLLGNAIKFSSKCEKPIIQVGSTENESEHIIYIKDNGVGFEMDYVHKIFTIFQRLHTDDEFEGTGVGLAIVQRILHRHGGRVWAESKMDEGATFYYSLPKQPLQ